MRRIVISAVLLLNALAVCASEAEQGAPLPEIPAAPVNGPEQWRGAEVALLGDSITDKFQTAKQRVWWQYLASWLGWKTHPHAIPGNQWNALDKQVDCMVKDREKGVEVQAVFILCGTNDYAGNVPMGEWYDVADAQVSWWGREAALPKRTLSVDMKTFRGRVNAVLGRIRREFPSAQIVLLTPFHRGATLKMPGEDCANGLGLFLDDYVKAVREAGDVWSVPVIDLHAEAGLMPMLDVHGHFMRGGDRKDHLHPNSEGHRRLAEVIYYKLNSMPSSL